MLTAKNRMRTSVDFSTTVRSGVRKGRRNLVLYAAPTAGPEPTRFGFIVAKTVGNAVVRNRVKRRLREAAAGTVSLRPSGLNVVVRALPASADATWTELCADYDAALASAFKRLDQQ
ncbi:ribonuclease P protein component [Paenarthrobacter sp. DKR-5]|nr:ribonuclease P protein component [Paenarthrobacter sp. DKR-5]